MAKSDLEEATKPCEPKKAPLIGDIAKEGFVIVKVGPEPQLYHVHKALITHHSEYFRNAFDGSWKEAGENSVSLADIEPATFDIFLHWLYRQEIPPSEELHRILSRYAGNSSDEKDLGPVAVAMPLTKSIVFGDRFLTPRFRQTANNALVNFIHEFRPVDGYYISEAKYAFENLPEDCVINKFFLDLHSGDLKYVTETDAIVEQMRRENMPQAYLLGLIAKYSRRAAPHFPSDEDDFVGHACQYHEHIDAKEREECSECSDCSKCKKNP